MLFVIFIQSQSASCKVPGCSAHSMWFRLPDSDKGISSAIRQDPFISHILWTHLIRFTWVQSSLINSWMGFWCILANVWLRGVKKFRGPFSNTTDWLSCSLRAEIFALKLKWDDYFDSNAGLTNMDAAVWFCSNYYPDDNPVIPHVMFFQVRCR